MFDEAVMRFGAHATLVGVYSRPSTPADCAVIILNAGLIHHVGPHRLHVRLARELARAGVASVRFDFSGIGDSPARPDHLPIFELVVREPREAMDALAAGGYRRFVLAGVCSGAYAAFKTAAADPRVIAAVLVNPQDFAAGGGAQAQSWERRYLTRSILRPRSWLNLLTGRVDYRRLFATLRARLSGRTGQADAQLDAVRTEVAAVLARGCRLLFVVSQDDVSTEYLRLLLGTTTGRDRAEVLAIMQSDHLFTGLAQQQRLADGIVGWTTAIARTAEAADRRPEQAGRS